MSYKSWNKIQLYKHLKAAEKIGDIIDIGIIKQLIDDTITPFDSDCYASDLEFKKNFLKEYAYYLPFIEDFSKTQLVEEKIVSPIYIPLNSQLDFLYDFFSNTAPGWMKLFDDIYKERKKNLKVSNSGNYSVYLSSIDYSYISINKNMMIEDLFNLVHEYTHSVVDRINYRFSYNSHYPFIELPPMCMEIISALYMTDYYLDIGSDVQEYLKEIFNIVIGYARNIVAINKNISDTDNEEKTLLHDTTYVIPFIHIFELLYLYLEDKEKWFYTLNKIINMPFSDNYLDEMKKLGLTPNKDLNRYINDLNNHLTI